MALFDSDDFEEYNDLTETEKIDLALALILDKRTRNEKIDFFFDDSKKKELAMSAEYRQKQPPEHFKATHRMLAEKKKEERREEAALRKVKYKKKALRDMFRAIGRFKKHERRDFKKNSWFEIIIHWPGT